MAKVSIVIPNYNMKLYIKAAVDSALAQTYNDIEIIVIDNASTDGSLTTIASYTDERLRIISNDQNLGAIKNFNKGIAEASGVYIKFLESDDMLEPECVAKMIRVMERDKDIVLCSCGRKLIDQKGSITSSHSKVRFEAVSGKLVRRRLRVEGNEFGTPTDVMVRRQILVECCGFDEEYGAYLNDLDLWLRVAERGKVAFLPEMLSVVRRHSQQIGALGAQNNSDVDAVLQTVNKCFPAEPAYAWALKVHFSAEYLRRALAQLIKTPSRKAVNYVCETFHRISKHIGIFAAFVSVLYFPTILQYLKVRHKLKHKNA